MVKKYVVMEIGYEYNDEVMHTTEGDYGTPRRIYSSKEKAEEVIKNLTISKYKSEEIAYYYYDMDELIQIDIDKFKMECYKILGEEGWEGIDFERFEMSSSWTDEQIEKLSEFITLEFYKIVEVEEYE